MLAARAYRGEHSLRLEQMELPGICAGEILIRNRVSGINRGTLSLWRQGRLMTQLPSVLGYEVAGEVAALGPGVNHLHIGDRVLAHTFLSCGDCEYCRSGEDADCPAAANMGHIHYSEAGLDLYRRYHNGGLAEFVRVPAASTELIPRSLSYEVAARTLSFAVAYRAICRLDLKPGATVAINGITGAFGAAAALLAPLFGVARVLGVARTAASLARVKAVLPAAIEYVVLEELDGGHIEKDGLRRALRERSGSDGLDGALDFAPSGTAVTAQVLGALRKGGTLVISGGNHEPMSFPYVFLMQNSLTLRGSRGGGRDITRALLRLAGAGHLDMSRIISHRFELPDINEAVAAIDSREEKPLFVSVAIP